MTVKIMGRPSRQGVAELIRLGEVKGDIIAYQNEEEGEAVVGVISEKELLNKDYYNKTIVEKFQVRFDGAFICFDGGTIIIEFDEDLDNENKEETIDSIKSIVFNNKHIDSVNKSYEG